jgi:hypothetical protein
MWRRSAALIVALAAAVTGSPADPPDLRGHLKLQGLGVVYPDESLLHDALGDRTLDLQLDSRLVATWDFGAWDVAADAQLVGQYGDAIEATRDLSDGLQPFFRRLPDDTLRVADLSHELADHGRGAAVVRLDRLSVGYTGASLSVRLGRQAISWGNGLIYNPMDIVNPFDPAAVDTEYKIGDDMITAQWLMPSGNDLQAVVVGRRDPVTGEVSSEAGTSAVKLHLFAGDWELDLLAAVHWDHPVLAVGAVRSVGGGVWRGDVVATDTDHGTEISAVTSYSSSWTWRQRNCSGLIELYWNGFGQSGGAYAPEDLAANPALLERFVRGELFTLGRAYLGLSATVEVTPLLLVTPNAFVNLEDPSGLLQVVVQADLSQDLRLVASASLPMGPDGSEFGGIQSGIPGRTLGVGPQLFVQFARYF